MVRFHNVTIFALQPELIRVGEFVKSEVEKIKVLRSTLYNGKPVLAVSLFDNFQTQVFKSVEEIRYGIKTVNKLAYPVLGPGDEVVFAIQLESRVNKRTNKDLGFTQADE